MKNLPPLLISFYIYLYKSIAENSHLKTIFCGKQVVFANSDFTYTLFYNTSPSDV